ncbi:divalent metal cation transporter, partial [bacterium]|nr:divalent metal cation transporter [bacterium]
AATLFFNKTGPVPVSSIEDIGRSLSPLAGKYAGYLFAVGLFNASIFGAAILPLSTAFAICEGMGWERGINKTYEEAPLFYWIFTSLIVLGSAIVLIPGASSLYLLIMRVSQVAQGLILPIFLYYLVKLGDNKILLGENVNPRWLSRISWASVILLSLVNLCFLGMAILE